MSKFSEILMQTAIKLVENCKAGTEKQGLEDYYHPECVSVEALDMSGQGREAFGIEAIKGKHDWWASAVDVHSSHTEGPFLHGEDKFAVIFEIDATWKETNHREKMKEVGLYTVNDAGKIIREEFFYSAELY